jgi:phenylalanyl-tRNA synthetase beta chain
MEIYRQPPATRDIAVVVPEAITAAEMLESIRQESALVAEARVFDVYQGSGVESGWRSIAIALVLRASGRTLTDAEANAAVDGIVAHLGDQFGARRR